MAKIARAIGEEEPDLVFLQEVWFSAYQRRLERELDSAYQAILYPRRVSGWPSGGLLVFVHRRTGWSVEESMFRRYDRAAPWWRLCEGDGLGGKGYLTIALRRNDERLVIVNTHLQSQYPEYSRRYEEIRGAQLVQLRTYLEELPPWQRVLIAGDFNTKPVESLFRSHLSILGNDLTEAERARRGGGTAFGENDDSKDWIDYVIARQFATKADVRLLVSDFRDTPYSDHDGLFVRLIYEKGPGKGTDGTRTPLARE